MEQVSAIAYDLLSEVVQHSSLALTPTMLHCIEQLIACQPLLLQLYCIAILATDPRGFSNF